jgi:hypothetical protein
MNLPNRCILTPEEFAFMNTHHEEIERASIACKCGDDVPLHSFINSEDYQKHFAGRLWDDILDRYEDTPGYDWTLRTVLHQKLKEDVESGRVTLV